jgi:hypothetical protein
MHAGRTGITHLFGLFRVFTKWGQMKLRAVRAAISAGVTDWVLAGFFLLL